MAILRRDGTLGTLMHRTSTHSTWNKINSIYLQSLHYKRNSTEVNQRQSSLRIHKENR